MRTLLAYTMVLPLSFLASRLGTIVVGGPIAFALNWASVWLRSTIAGFVGCVGGVASAVAFGWCVFRWVVGPGSFTLAPFLASVLVLTVASINDFPSSKSRAQMQAEFQTSGQQWLADEIGNPWSTVAGEACGLMLASAWFFLA